MIKETVKGFIYEGKLYQMSKADKEWVKKENKKDPKSHPARNLRSLAHTIYEVE